MPKPILYILLLIETILLIVFGVMFIQLSTEAEKTAIEPISFSSRDMTVFVKSVGKGDSAVDVVGKMYVQDDATGRSEFLFDVGAGCFPTWTLNPQQGYHLLVVDDADVDNMTLETLMREALLRYEFKINGDLQITKTMGIRSASLNFNQHRLILNQQCS